MSLLHQLHYVTSPSNEPPETGVNDVLVVEGHWLDQHFRVNVRQNSTISARLHCASHRRDNDAYDENDR